MEDYQKRLITEYDELVDRYFKLKNFMSTEQYQNLNEEDRNLLARQRYHMQDYVDVLGIRIDRFKRKEGVDATTH